VSKTVSPAHRWLFSMRKLIQHIWTTRDFASAALLTVIAASSCWVLCLPLSSTVQKCYLNRFHLSSASFPAWAMQQPVPAMYNLENRFWVSPSTLSKTELRDSEFRSTVPAPTSGPQLAAGAKPTSEIGTSALNHFPARTITFGGSRAVLKENPNKYFYLRSRYRGRELLSSYRTIPVSDSEVRVERIESEWSDPSTQQPNGLASQKANDPSSKNRGTQ
jgi:hypothetical protein